MSASTTRERVREAGVSLLELLVVITIAVVGFTMAVALMPSARHTADLNGTVDQLIFDLERASTSADARGRDVTYAVSQLVYPADRLRINEAPVLPDGVRSAAAITFESGTGRAQLDSGTDQAAITISVAGSDLHMGVFVGRSGKVTPMKYVEGRWMHR